MLSTLARRPVGGRVVLAALALALSGCQAEQPATIGHPGASPGPPSPRSVPGGPSPTPSATPGNPGGLSDAQLVGQLFMSYVYGSSATVATPAQRAANIALYGVPTGADVVARWHLGGVILIDHNTLDPARPYLSTGNVGSPGQVAALDRGLQAAALADSGQPLLIATDEEGGRVQRLAGILAPRASQLRLATLGPTALRCSYFQLGQGLRSLGVNQDFAPVADVVRTRTGVIGDRSFGPDPVRDAADVAQAVAGLQAAGVLATLKHWPGHGSTATDSHAALAVIRESAAQWRAVDRQAFAAAATDAAAVMVGHLALPALDPSGLPATLSSRLVNGALRSGLGFRGLTVTDSLYMEPARAAGAPGPVSLQALLAGDDLLLETPDLPAAESTILAAITASPSTRAVVVGAVTRILAAKARAGRPPASHC